jgi:para-nitrobenzyl esterase
VCGCCFVALSWHAGLYLNVWAPADASNLPVMVYIHGGGFTYGSPSSPTYDGEDLSSRANIVIVNVAYRLGALGFLHTPTVDSQNGLYLLLSFC